MANQLNRMAICAPSEEIVAREIEGEIIIVPLTSGIGDAEDELYTLNETGKAIWQLLDGKRTMQDVARALSAEFNCDAGKIEGDVIGLAEELLKRRILVEVSGT
jgi:hypothetical protein